MVIQGLGQQSIASLKSAESRSARKMCLTFDFVVVGVQGVAGEAELVEDAVAQLGPLVGEHLAGVAPDFLGHIHVGQEIERDRHEVPRKAAALALLDKWTRPINRMFQAHVHIRFL